MGKIRQKIASGFQWKLKWVRVMLIVSAVAILGLIFIPKFGQEKMAYQIKESIEAPAAEEMAEIDGVDSIRRTIHINRPVPVERLRQLPPEEEPFDWKGMVTWAIGVANGLILVILNVKNLLLKKK